MVIRTIREVSNVPVDNREVVVLCSGGMDSSSLLALLKNQGWTILPITFYYGSKHNDAEFVALNNVCSFLDISEPIRIDISILKDLFKSSILQDQDSVPHGHYASKNMASTVVPGRNSIMLSFALGIAQSNKIPWIAIANHAGDTMYPDCQKEFIDYLAASFQVASEGLVGIMSPFVNIDKSAIASIGNKNNLPLEMTWSCYEGDLQKGQCGLCGTCVKEGTGVLMENFTYKPIEQVIPGDKIFSINEHTFNFEIAQVTKTWDNGIKKVFPYGNGHKISITKNHKVPSRSQNDLTWRSFDELHHKGCNRYFTYFMDPKYAISNLREYSIGYMRGIVDGDGRIDRGVNLFQKDVEVLEEFLMLYNKYLRKTDAKVLPRSDDSTMHYIGCGYGPYFKEVSAFKFERNYVLGYLAGVNLADGCFHYTPSGAFQCSFSQKADNLEVLGNVKNALNLVGIDFTEYTGLQKGKDSFVAGGVIMTSIYFWKLWRLPVIFGGLKKRNFIQKLIDNKKITRYVDKIKIDNFNPNEGEESRVHDLTTTSGTYICEGYPIHNCTERNFALLKAGLIDKTKYQNDPKTYFTDSEKEELGLIS